MFHASRSIHSDENENTRQRRTPRGNRIEARASGFDNSWRAADYFRVTRKLFSSRPDAAGGDSQRIRRALAAGDGPRVVLRSSFRTTIDYEI